MSNNLKRYACPIYWYNRFSRTVNLIIFQTDILFQENMNVFVLVSNYWRNFPLRSILILALFFRLLAVIFAQGYGMHDDHFIAIEEPWSWTQGEDYNGWLPGTKGPGAEPSIYSFFYPGVNYLLFEGMQSIGIDNPKTEMFFIRLILALFSLLAVFYGYKITEAFANKKIAQISGILLAVLWFMPFFSVRNLVEVIATPILLTGIWQIIKIRDVVSKRRIYLSYLISGLIIGIAVSLRYQVAIIVLGIAIALLFDKRVIGALIFGMGSLISFAIIQGGLDYLVWGKPFEVFIKYVEYNIEHKNNYGNQDNFLMYFQLIPGILIPPVGLFLFFGFFLKIRKHLLIFLPVALFIIFHTVFPNRQERFILTIVPMVVILGTIGWSSFAKKSKFWKKFPGLLKASYVFFWVLNSMFLLITCFTYSKKSRVEAMHYFYSLDEKVQTILVEDTGRERIMMMPVFYAGKAINVVAMPKFENEDNVDYSTMWSYINVANSFKIFEQDNGIEYPDYIVFVEDINLNERVDKMKKIFPNLHFEKYIEPSLSDKVMKWLNPRNRNEDFYIYKTGVH